MLLEEPIFIIQTHLKLFRRIYRKHDILLKINSVTDTLIIICRKSEQIFLTMAPDRDV